MITQGLVVLINYGIHLAPGLWFALTPKSLPGAAVCCRHLS
ncbi:MULTISPECIES: hypothetical protein [Pseudomonas]|jgi:uncharacterized protein|nr:MULTISPECIES: hypothetical protein [Pseudomonas]